MDGIFHIGIDDTDHGESIGTGALARELALHLEGRLGARSLGVTRHQLLVHPDIPYTSHNSAACIVLEWTGTLQRLEEACTGFISYLEHDGADPGLCLVNGSAASDAWLAFSRAARDTVVSKQDALALAKSGSIVLRELGGTGLGVIGALAACGLRMTGDDGRFISLPGIRQVRGRTTAGGILASTSVDRVVDESGETVAEESVVETHGWVRPDLRGGRAVLVLTRDGAGFHIDRKKRRQQG